jgi:hypothetical protein
MMFTSRGKVLGSSPPSLATFVDVIEQTLNVDFGKFSQGERVQGLPLFGVD